MKHFVLLLTFAIPLLAQDSFDFKSLDKLGANAKESTNINLEGQTLRLATSFLGDEKDASAVKSLIANLKAIRVRSWEFDKEGMYSAADLAPFRSWIQAQQWTKIVDVREQNETSEVFMKPGDAGKLGGIAVVSTEPRELTIVFIEGSISPADLNKLSGSLDLPNADLLKRGTQAAPKSNANGKKDE